MKTPREILFARHQAAKPRLDAIRQAAVAAVCDRRESASDATERRSQTAATTRSWAATLVSVCLRGLTTPWRELILPTRRIWTGLATVWVLIFIINLSQRDTTSSVTGQPVRSPAVMMSLEVQQRWMNELFADRSTPPEADRPKNIVPKPRTEKNEMTPA
jgi:hypothetical protein